jgi:hypothetical protein
MEPSKPLPREHSHGVALGIILSLVTCGLYNIYWNYRQFRAMNVLLGREEYNFVMWLVLSILTCGLYHIYYEYKMGSDLQAYMRGAGFDVSPNLAIIGLALSCFGMTVVADAVYQHELNRLCD